MNMWEKVKEQVKTFWVNSTRRTKAVLFGIIAILVALIVTISLLATKVDFVPLYANVSLEEVGQIKSELEERNIPYEISDNGTTINVPEEQRQAVLVDLAGLKIPSSGNIDYSFFSDNISWGITENEFNIIKLNAMQTELSNLIKGIDGIEDANVLINLPEESVFVSESEKDASVAIMLQTKYGHEFSDNQIEALYHLISRALPNLDEENISIIDQYSNTLSKTGNSGSGDLYTTQQNIKRDIEKDIQHRLQEMLSVMVGMDSVMVSVTADIDFKSEQRVEELVTPVDVDNIEGLPVSIETITEAYSGGQVPGGVVGTGDEDTTNYPAGIQGDDGEYELVKDTINYELNRIYKEIAESPYRVRDLGIQVVVDNVRTRDGETVEYLSQQEQSTVEEGIASILSSMITTSIDKEFGEIDPEQKISIVFQEFNDRQLAFSDQEGTAPGGIPNWVYYVGGAGIVLILLLLFLLFRRRSGNTDEVDEEEFTLDAGLLDEQEIPDIPTQPLSESEIKKQQLENMVKDHPEDFTKLLRSWISED